MERIGIVGLSLQDTDVTGLERLARPGPHGPAALARELADALGASEVVLLATCNRVEVVFARESGHLPSPDDRAPVAGCLGLPPKDPLVAELHFHAGTDAARYLFRVAASLESVVLGEDQILAQMRAAYGSCEQAGLVGRLLATLFEHAFQAGKRVRSETALACIPVSVVSLGLQAVVERGRGKRAAVIGAGAVARHVVREACDLGLTIAFVANRTLARAEELACTCGARATTIAGLLLEPEGPDVLLCATAAPGYVLSAADLRLLASRTPRALVAVDLAVPRDLEPLVDARVEIVDMEALRDLADRNRRARADAALEAEELIEERIRVLVRRSGASVLARTLAEVSCESERILERELTQLAAGRLARLDAEERRAIEHWARTAFGRVTHVSLSALKRVVNDHNLFGAGPGEGVS